MPEIISRKYYSSRTRPRQLSLMGLYQKLQCVYFLFRDKDYFKEHFEITRTYIPESINNEALIYINFQPFPMNEWESSDITEDHIFDTIEFLYDRISKPGELKDMVTETGFNYFDYGSYDRKIGKKNLEER